MHFRIRDAGWRLPLRPGGVIEGYDDQHRLCFELDAAILIDLLAVYIRQARIVAALGASERGPSDLERLRLPPAPQNGPPPALVIASKPPARIPPALQAERRAARKSRRRAV